MECSVEEAASARKLKLKEDCKIKMYVLFSKKEPEKNLLKNDLYMWSKRKHQDFLIVSSTSTLTNFTYNYYQHIISYSLLTCACGASTNMLSLGQQSVNKYLLCVPVPVFQEAVCNSCFCNFI